MFNRICTTCLALVILITGIARGQTPFYTHSTPSATPYASLSSPTVLTSPGWSSGVFWWLPCPIDFSFYGQDVDSIFIHSDGWLGMNYHIMDLFSADYKDLAGPLPSSIGYQVSGAVGSRVLTFEWRNAGLLFDTDNNSALTFQGRLFEGTNCIEIQVGGGYVFPGDWEDSGTPGSEVGPRIGMENEVLPEQVYLTGDNLAPTLVNDFTMPFGVPPTVTGLAPGNTTYRFCPTPVSVDKPLVELDFMLSPVPAMGQLDIRLDGLNPHEVMSVDLMDVTGRVLFSKFWPKHEKHLRLDLEGIPPGIHMVRLDTQRGTLSRNVTIL